MTRLTFTLLSVLLSSTAHSELRCTGELNLQGGFFYGNCSGSSCSAFLPSNSVMGSGNCGSSATVRVQGFSNGGFISGQCNGSSLSILMPSERIQLQGNCSNGRAFVGEAEKYGNFQYGSCTQNGSMNVFVPSEEVSFSGYCN